MQIPFPGDPLLHFPLQNQMYGPTLVPYSPHSDILIHFQKLCWLFIFFLPSPTLRSLTSLRPGIASGIKDIKINDCAGRSREEARAQQLSNMWCQKKPKQHYSICNELDLLLELAASLLQQLGTIAGKSGREQSTAARGGWS